MFRNYTKTIKIGDRVIGGDSPVLIRSMYNTKAEDMNATMNQVHKLEQAGCDIIQVVVPTVEAARALSCVREEMHISLVADIHFDYHLATVSIENGANRMRVNPGNIGDHEKVKAIVSKAKEYNIPIKVGVNNGSLEKSLLERYGDVTAEGIVGSALDKVGLIEDTGYDNLMIDIRPSGVIMCVKARELVASRAGYPLHMGITESGTLSSNNIKLSVGLEIVLYQGVGDTTRVFLTEGPVEEIKSARLILYTLGLRSGGIEMVSCPTCSRTRVDLIGLTNQVETIVSEFDDLGMGVAIMGCVVGGPSRAGEAGIGIIGGVDEGPLIKKRKIIREVPKAELLPMLYSEPESMWS